MADKFRSSDFGGGKTLIRKGSKYDRFAGQEASRMKNLMGKADMSPYGGAGQSAATNKAATSTGDAAAAALAKAYAKKPLKKFQEGGMTDWEQGKKLKLGKIITEDLPKDTGKGDRLRPRSIRVASK